jgi:hypothetical protein
MQRVEARIFAPSLEAASHPMSREGRDQAAADVVPTFQNETTRPRSLVLNQCTIVLPHGGQAHALDPAIDDLQDDDQRERAVDRLERRPDTAISAHESSRPSGRKYFGLLRSDTDPIRNFETP